MPSSSARDTSQEDDLRRCYKIAFGRLYHNNMHREAQYINTAFLPILDMTPKELLAYFRSANYEAFRAHIWKQNYKKRENVQLAADALMDAGSILFKNGRGKEGREICEFGQKVYEFAGELWDSGR